MRHKVIILALLLITLTLTVRFLFYPRVKATKVSDKKVTASPKVIWVPDNHTRIQWAIGNASSGDIIRVRAGTYHEHLIINKSLTLIGEDPSTTIIDGEGTGNVVSLDTNNVTIAGFTIHNGENSIYINGTLFYVLNEEHLAVSLPQGTWDNMTCPFDGSQLTWISILYFPGWLDAPWRFGYYCEVENIFWIVDCNGWTEAAWYGPFEGNSRNNVIISITVSNSSNGIFIDSRMTPPSGGYVYYPTRTRIYHNNFINNTQQVYTNGSINIWDNGYPSGGNYWSDYNGTDIDQDGIGDSPCVIDEKNTDNYPLMGMFSNFTISWEEEPYHLTSICNSTISNFQFNASQKMISFNVTGANGTVGFCRITIPNIIIQDLWHGNYTVLVDGEEPLMFKNWTDGTNTYLYFTYIHSEHEVTIIPEFPSALILPLLMIVTLFVVVLRKNTNAVMD